MSKGKRPKLILPPEGVDLPGPVYNVEASHWVEYNHRSRIVVTFCRVGPAREFKLKTRIRPMRGSEIIHSKLRHHSREDVLRAYGVELSELTQPRPVYIRPGFFTRLWRRLF